MKLILKDGWKSYQNKLNMQKKINIDDIIKCLEKIIKEINAVGV